jgi:starch synthase
VTAPVVLWVTSEALPWASTGGLADVAGSLPAVLRSMGWDVRLCLPNYSRLHKQRLSPPLCTADVGAHGKYRVLVRQAEDPPGGVPTYLIECAPLFDRDGVYGEGGGFYADNAVRYGVLQLGARALAEALDPAPAIIHCHDWHTALLPALLQFSDQRPERLAATSTVLTIHNLQFQGDFDRGALEALGLPRELWHPKWGEHFGKGNSLKAGILSADRVTTVSPTYANEILDPARGMGLDGPLRERGHDFRGILNGIDGVSWDPEHDAALAAPFSADDPSGRSKTKAGLRKETGLHGAAADPLIGFVGRVTRDKGVDLLIDALPEILDMGAKVVVLGSGDQGLEAALSYREREYPDRFRAAFRFDPQLARHIYAGVDVLVVPSRSEPCGLVQLYGLRYGAIPVAHAVGGLRDTIRDGETGFLFHEPTPTALVAGVRRALEAFKSRTRWARLRDNALRANFDWRQSAASYDALYRELLSAPPRRRPLPSQEDGVPSQPADWGPALPPVLGAETLRLMVQAPRTMFSYWESSAPAPLTLFLEERPSGLLFEVSADRAAIGDFWFASEPEHAYRAILRRPDGSVAAISNAVLTPRESPVGPDEAMPAWLERAFALGLFADQAPAAAWDEAFPTEPRLVHGARRFDGTIGGNMETWPHSAALFVRRPEGTPAP